MFLSRSLRLSLLKQVNLTSIISSSKLFSTSTISKGIFSSTDGGDNLVKRILKRFSGPSTGMLHLYGNNLYQKTADEVVYTKFFEVCNMEDTFASWFTVMELHVWMLSARLMEENPDGRVIRNGMIKAMWEDVNMKSRKLDGAVASARRQQVSILNESFQAAMIGYDEGLLGNDKILAGALWRRFLNSKEPTNQDELLKQIVAVEMLVLYVRYQFKLLNELSRENLIKHREFQYVPFNSTLFEIAEKSRSTAAY